MKLSKTDPLTGKRNPYRTRWTTVEGVQFIAESDSLDGIWMVGIDTEALRRYAERYELEIGRTVYREVSDAIHALVITPVVPGQVTGESVYAMSCRIAYRLYGHGRTVGEDTVEAAITEVVEGEHWETIRTAYRAIIDRIDAAAEADRERRAAWAALT